MSVSRTYYFAIYSSGPLKEMFSLRFVSAQKINCEMSIFHTSSDCVYLYGSPNSLSLSNIDLVFSQHPQPTVHVRAKLLKTKDVVS